MAASTNPYFPYETLRHKADNFFTHQALQGASLLQSLITTSEGLKAAPFNEGNQAAISALEKAQKVIGEHFASIQEQKEAILSLDLAESGAEHLPRPMHIITYQESYRECALEHTKLVGEISRIRQIFETFLHELTNEAPYRPDEYVNPSSSSYFPFFSNLLLAPIRIVSSLFVPPPRDPQVEHSQEEQEAVLVKFDSKRIKELTNCKIKDRLQGLLPNLLERCKTACILIEKNIIQLPERLDSKTLEVVRKTIPLSYATFVKEITSIAGYEKSLTNQKKDIEGLEKTVRDLQKKLETLPLPLPTPASSDALEDHNLEAIHVEIGVETFFNRFGGSDPIFGKSQK